MWKRMGGNSLLFYTCFDGGVITRDENAYFAVTKLSWGSLLNVHTNLNVTTHKLGLGLGELQCPKRYDSDLG